MSDFYCSDPHFGHSNILHGSKDGKQPFEREVRKIQMGWQNTKQMDEGIIDIFNSIVPKDATTTWLGDMFWYGKKWAKQTLVALNGEHVVICGNHDWKPHQMMSLGFKYACCSATTMIAGHVVNLSHFQYKDTMEPDNKYYDRAPKYEGKWLIHGHVHSRFKEFPEFKMINVGMDAREFRPVSREWLEKYIQKTEHSLKVTKNSTLNDQKHISVIQERIKCYGRMLVTSEDTKRQMKFTEMILKKF